MSTLQGNVRLLVHWWREEDGAIQMEIMEQSIEPIDEHPERPGEIEECLSEDLSCAWISDYCLLKEHVSQEVDEGFLDFQALMVARYYTDTYTGETDSDVEFENEQVRTLTESEADQLSEKWPGVEIDDDQPDD
jgi:hypothetical protein